jgi:hypothetical protein
MADQEYKNGDSQDVSMNGDENEEYHGNGESHHGRDDDRYIFTFKFRQLSL